MSKAVKNLLLSFTLVSIIILIIFVIELVIVNREAKDDGNSRTSVSNNTPAETEENSAGTPLLLTNNATAPAERESPSSESHQPTGTQCKLQYSISESLILYYDEELFEHNSELEMADEFTYKDGQSASLMILFKAIPLGAKKTAESVLDGYLDGNVSDIGSEGPIGRSALTGEYVTGVNNGETFEAWVHTVSDNIGRVFIVRYSDDEQKNALYAILDTLELAPV